MTNWSERTELLLGNERVNYLKEKHVLVVGLGGVGAYAAEMICRAGIGKMTIIDADKVNASNINRQLPATHATLGQLKADVMAQRLRDINPDIELNVIAEFIKDEKIPEILESAKFDFVVDAIDSLSPKVYLIYNAYKMQLPIVSSMGAGGKIDPSQVKIADISKSHNCALAKAVRKRLNRLDVRKGIPVVFSTEFADENAIVKVENEQNKISTAGTISYL
ncbi:MAG: tRNA threonylcarbamoyladenosine dehydratase, partial [Tannerellaceae bacterium]